MKKMAVTEYGMTHLLESNWGLLPSNSLKIAMIIVCCGSIEYYTERAIWKCQNITPEGIRPDTDSKPITKLIAKFEDFSNTLIEDHDKRFLKQWCSAARSGFLIRNNIAYGVAIKMDKTPAFMRNPRWHGEIRGRSFGDFWADDQTLDLVCDSLAVLLRIIVKVEKGELTLREIATPLASRALRESYSILGEFSSQDYNPEFEKY